MIIYIYICVYIYKMCFLSSLFYTVELLGEPKGRDHSET
jgi:hypothetical protein